MAKIRTLGALQDALDAEFAWRLKEISALKLSVRGAHDLAEPTLVRAGIALLYAHWEGFIKSAAHCYIDYVNNTGLKYVELSNCLAVLGLRSYLSSIAESRKIVANLDAYEFITNVINTKANISLSESINTESNLSSIVFENIARSLNISTEYYRPNYNLIDKELLKRRNKIAHGEFLDMSAADWRLLADEILLTMRHFKTDIENGASLGQFKA